VTISLASARRAGQHHATGRRPREEGRRFVKKSISILVAALALAGAPVARADPPQPICAVLLPDHAGTQHALRAAAEQITVQGCEAGDALLVIGTAYEPRAVAAAFCRRGAAVHISEVPYAGGVQSQLDCELPLLPAARRAAR
jgi:hypothetical protein